jgi:hypothetical protein
VNEPERTGDRFEGLLDRGVIRRLLLQKTERASRRFERSGSLGCRGSASRLLDLEECSHRVGDRFGDAHQLRRHLGIGLDCAERSGKCLASGFRSRDGIGHEPS